MNKEIESAANRATGTLIGIAQFFFVLFFLTCGGCVMCGVCTNNTNNTEVKE